MIKNLGRNNIFLMVALLVWALGEGQWFNVRTLYLSQLGATAEQIGTVLMVEAFARALLPVPAGIIANRIGPYRVMLASWTFGVLGAVVMGLASTWQTVIPGLILYGLSAFAIPALSAYALMSLPDRNLPGIEEKTLTSLFAAYPVGLIISPTVGGYLAERWSIRLTIWLSAGLFIVSTLIILLVLQEMKPAARSANERSAHLLRNSAFLKQVGFFTILAGVMLLAYVLMPNFFEEVRGLSLATIGSLFSIYAVGSALLNMGIGRLPLRWGVGSAMAVYWVAVFGLWQVSNIWGVRGLFLLLSGVSVIRALAAASVSKVVHPQNHALAFGLLESGYALSTAAASQMAGQLYVLTPSHQLPLMVTVVALPVMLLVWVVMKKPSTRASVEQASELIT